MRSLTLWPNLLHANIITEVCHKVCIEPQLQELSGELLHHATSIIDEGAHLDIWAKRVLGRLVMMGILRCKGIQSQCTIQPVAPTELCLPSPWEATILWAACQRGQTWSLHTTHVFHIWRHFRHDCNSLQEAGLAACLQAWAAIQHCYGMVVWLWCHLSFSLLRSAVRCLRWAHAV